MMTESEYIFQNGYPIPDNASYTVELMILGFHPSFAALQPIIDNGLLKPDVIEQLSAIQLQYVLEVLRAMAGINGSSDDYDEPSFSAMDIPGQQEVKEGYEVFYEGTETKQNMPPLSASHWTRWKRNPRIKTPRGQGRYANKNKESDSGTKTIFRYRLPY